MVQKLKYTLQRIINYYGCLNKYFFLSQATTYKLHDRPNTIIILFMYMNYPLSIR